MSFKARGSRNYASSCRFQGHEVTSLDVLRAQLMHDLFAIAKLLL